MVMVCAITSSPENFALISFLASSNLFNCGFTVTWQGETKRIGHGWFSTYGWFACKGQLRIHWIEHYPVLIRAAQITKDIPAVLVFFENGQHIMLCIQWASHCQWLKHKKNNHAAHKQWQEPKITQHVSDSCSLFLILKYSCSLFIIKRIEKIRW